MHIPKPKDLQLHLCTTISCFLGAQFPKIAQGTCHSLETPLLKQLIAVPISIIYWKLDMQPKPAKPVFFTSYHIL